MVLFPFSDVLVKLATFSVPQGKAEKGEGKTLPGPLLALDERFLDRPSFAMSLCKDAVDHMADLARNSFQTAMDVLGNYSEKGVDTVAAMEQEADSYEDVLGTYLVKLSSRDLNKADSRTLTILMHCINDFERDLRPRHQSGGIRQGAPRQGPDPSPRRAAGSWGTMARPSVTFWT